MVAENLEDTLMGPEPEEEDANVFYDVAMAPFRGAEGALYSAYQLADDYLLNDVLPDWESRALGTSKTIPGMAVEGVSQFLTGWFPFLRATKGLALAGKGAKALRGIGTAAAADFTAFQGQENRLSNLIQQVPELQNPVTEFLAHDADEGEIEGRLKNVLEGLGLEALGFAFIRGLKAVKDGKTKYAETGSEQAVRDIVSERLEGGASLSLAQEPPAFPLKSLDEELGEITPELKEDFYNKTITEQVAGRMQTGTPMTVREALQDLSNRTNGKLGQYTPIVKKLLALEKNTGIDARLEDRAFASNLPVDLPKGSFYESGKRRVVFDGRSGMLQRNPVYTLLHEGTHAVTVDNVNKYFDANSFNKIDNTDIAGRAKAIDEVLKRKDLPKPIAEMFRMFKKADSMRDDIAAKGKLKTIEGKPDLYWIKNPAEFMSMAFSDPMVQQALKGIQYTPKMTMWEKIVNTVKSFFGRGVSTDLADNIVSRVGEIAEMKLPEGKGRGIDMLPEGEVSALDRWYYSDLAKQSDKLLLDQERRIYTMDFTPVVRGEPMLYSELKKRLDNAIEEEAYEEAGELQFYLNRANKKIEAHLKRVAEEEGINLSSLDFSPEAQRAVPNFNPTKQDEFLNEIPEYFREYVGAVLRGQSIDMPQFRTDNDGYVLKEILDNIAENDPKFVERYTKGWKNTDTFKTGDEVVDNAYAGQLLNMDPIEAAQIARRQQAVWRVEGKGLVEKVLKAKDEVKESGFGEVPSANLKNAFQELVEFADRYRRLGREGSLLLGERREKFRGIGRKVGLDEAEVLTDGVRREYLNKSGNWTKKAKELVEILEYVDPDDLDGAIATVTGIAKKSQGKSWLDMPLEYWMNSILSGSAQIVNAVGAGFTSTMHTLETAIGGLFSANPRIAKEALAGWADLASINEGFKLYIQALKNDRTFFNQANKFDLRDPAIIPERFGLRRQQSQQVSDWDLEQGIEPMNQTSKAYKAIDILGKVIRLPSRHLTAQDTFFKTIFARRELRLRLALDALKDADAGVPREVIAERIQKQLSGLIDENGRAFSEETLIREGLAEADAKGLKGTDRAKYAMQYKQTQSKSVDTYNKLKAVGMADHLTMMEELKPGIAKGLQTLTNNHPALKLVLPFIRTPANILNYAIGRTPLGKQFYKDLGTVWKDTRDRLQGGALDNAYDDLSKALESADPLVAARARGRLAVSTISVGVLMDTYFNNRLTITGGGPSDEKQIAQLKQTGWRPYSIKIGDTYYSYIKLDPYATILGTIADLVETGIKEDRGFDESGLQHLTSALIVTVQRNVLNKSYMTGLDTLVKLGQQPEIYADYALQSFGSSLLPFSSALGRLNEYQGDQISREINSLKEAILYKIPGQRDKLDPKRNILGETMISENKPLFGVINPIAYSTEKSSAVLKEMADLKHAFRQPSSRRAGGLIEMLNFTNQNGQSSYDRWLELMGSMKIGRRTLNESLEKLIKSKRYNKLLPFSPETGLESPRVRAINKIIGKYRSRAFNDMLKESYINEDGVELADIHERVNRAKIIAARGASREDVLELLAQ